MNTQTRNRITRFATLPRAQDLWLPPPPDCRMAMGFLLGVLTTLFLMPLWLRLLPWAPKW
jgi:hypothetical protein